MLFHAPLLLDPSILYPFLVKTGGPSHIIIVVAKYWIFVAFNIRCHFAHREKKTWKT